MTELTIDRSEWATSFRKLVANLSGRKLRPQKGKPSDKTDCASFELDPQLDFDEVYLECRFEVFSKEATTEALEKHAARIIIVFPVEAKSAATETSEFIRSRVPAGTEVRVSKSGRRIYITRQGLPEVDMTVHVSKQVPAIKSYAETAMVLQSLWEDLAKALKDRPKAGT